jgi:hypothetical protein
VTAGPRDDDSAPTTGLLLLQRSDLARLAQTWDVTTACQDETLIKTGIEHEGLLAVLDFGQDLPADTPEEYYDLLIASDITLGAYASNPAEAVARMCTVVKQGGLMCLLATDRVVASIRPVLAAGNMDTTVLHRADAGPGLIIARRRQVPGTTGTADGTAAGASDQIQITLVHAANPTKAALAVASRLTACLEKHGYETLVFSWGSDVSTLAGKSCITLLEFEQPLLRDLGAEDFESVKKLLLETKKLFWVTALDDPGAAIIDGLVRVVRNETPGLSVRVFHADELSSLVAPPESLAELIVRAFLGTGEDNEFQVKGGLVHICRLEEDIFLNEEINSLRPGAAKTIANLPLGEVQYPVKLCVQSPGMLSSVCLEPDDSAETELEPDFVEIQTKATALK